MSSITTEDERGDKVTYSIRRLSWAEGKEILRKAIRSKDPTDYIEDLVIATVTKLDGSAFTKETLAKQPAALVRKLMDETLRLNDISRPEANFLPT